MRSKKINAEVELNSRARRALYKEESGYRSRDDRQQRMLHSRIQKYPRPWFGYGWSVFLKLHVL